MSATDLYKIAIDLSVLLVLLYNNISVTKTKLGQPYTEYNFAAL